VWLDADTSPCAGIIVRVHEPTSLDSARTYDVGSATWPVLLRAERCDSQRLAKRAGVP
jgi:hypothetical protein